MCKSNQFGLDIYSPWKEFTYMDNTYAIVQINLHELLYIYCVVLSGVKIKVLINMSFLKKNLKMAFFVFIKILRGHIWMFKKKTSSHNFIS